MASIQIETPPLCEPVDLTVLKQHLRVSFSDDDMLLSGYISAAREVCELHCGRSFINKGYLETFDQFPYWVDDTQDRHAYPTSYYALPGYASTMCNYSQVITLHRSRLRSVSQLRYVAASSYQWITLTGSTDVSNPSGADFIIDINSEPPRIFPRAQGFWPPVPFGVLNCVEAHFTAGCNDDAAIATAVAAYHAANPSLSQTDLTAYESSLRQADVPNTIKVAIMQLASSWYANRESVSPGNIKEVPHNLQFLLDAHKVIDYTPLRG